MDFSEPTRILFDRIKNLEPDNVVKILGYLFLKGCGDQERITLAMSPDSVFEEVIYTAKAELEFQLKSVSSPISPSLKSPPVSELRIHSEFASLSELHSEFASFSPPSLRFSSQSACRVPSHYWDHQAVPAAAKRNPDFVPVGYADSVLETQNQAQFLGVDDQIEHVNFRNTGFSGDYFCSDAALGSFSSRAGRRHLEHNEFSVKTCHYFKKGFCKHGSNCRYFHGPVSDGLPQLLDSFSEDHLFSAGSLKKLEIEIVEILKSKKGNPISIAALPMIYYEKYGKLLQAEGYLTESQRHGKAGYSLTKLLARLKNSIRLIDRPHGQHAVILAEDAPKYMDFEGNHHGPGSIVSGSRQIYLTFPAESTFTEDDVSNYFSTFGPVEDVRIPCQQKRMFGFVTFETADTVKVILAKGNPHFVCGARVLVKPYREKSKLNDRKYHERIEPGMYHSPNYTDMDADFQSFRRLYEASRLLRRQLMEEQEQVLEYERRRLAELQVASKPNQGYFGYCTDSLKSSEDHVRYLLEVLNPDSGNDSRNRHLQTSFTDQDSEGLNLPESPFASSNN